MVAQFGLEIAAIEQLIAQKEIAEALKKFDHLRENTSFIFGESYFQIYSLLASYCIAGELTQYTYSEYPISHYRTDFCWKDKNILVLGGGKDGMIKIWSLATDECIFSVKGYTGAVEALCFSPDGTQVLSCGKDGGEWHHTEQIKYRISRMGNIGNEWTFSVKLWDIASGECIYNPIEYSELQRNEMGGYSTSGRSVCFSPDGSKALTCSDYTTAKLWDIKNRCLIHSLWGHQKYVYYVCFSPDGRQALTVSDDQTIKIWDVASGICTRTFELDDEDGNAKAVCFSPDGRNILFGNSNNSALKLWNLDTGKCILTMDRNRGCVFTSCFSPDGRKCISNSEDGTVKLWDIATGSCICTFDEMKHYGAQKISFKNGGRSIIIASDAIYFYTLDNELRFPGWHDWDEGARPYLDIFRCIHPNWTDDDFDNILIRDLQNRGFGWLRPEGVRVELEKMK